MMKWEYKVLTHQVDRLASTNEVESSINDMGQDGWELVSVTPDYTKMTQWIPYKIWKSDSCVFVFKRPLDEDGLSLNWRRGLRHSKGGGSLVG